VGKEYPINSWPLGCCAKWGEALPPSGAFPLSQSRSLSLRACLAAALNSRVNALEQVALAHALRRADSCAVAGVGESEGRERPRGSRANGE